MIKPPNPGSDEATKLGCKCPVMDNHAGEGFYMGDNGPMFWMVRDCPLHGEKKDD
jgi:hypothetical protein